MDGQAQPATAQIYVIDTPPDRDASGGGSRCHQTWPQVMANRISVVSLDNLIQQQMSYDFPECKHAEKLEMSIEDRQFMESVSQSIKLVDGHYCIDLPLKKKDVAFPNN